MKVILYGTCEISLTFGNGSSFWDIVGLANTSPDFDVKKIRVYGIAKYYDTYKGIGIKKKSQKNVSENDYSKTVEISRKDLKLEVGII